MQVMYIFPTTIAMQELNRDLSDNERSIFNDELQKLQKNVLNNYTVNTKILDISGLIGLREWMEDCVKDYLFDLMRYKQQIRPFITQSWLNVTKTSEAHHIHRHQNSIISGVFYINADEETDKIFFYKDEYKQITMQAEEFNERNSNSWWVPCVKNNLILFPSNLSHSVDIIKKDNHERISLSFNTFAKGCFGEDDSLNLLNL